MFLKITLLFVECRTHDGSQDDVDDLTSLELVQIAVRRFRGDGARRLPHGRLAFYHLKKNSNLFIFYDKQWLEHNHSCCFSF